MPAPVVIVNNNPALLEQATAALRDAGHDVAPFVDPMAALDALEAARRAEVLVTRITFPTGKPNGISLALMARMRCPRLQVIFTARSEYEQYAEGVGEFMPHPVDLAKLVERVTYLVEERRR